MNSFIWFGLFSPLVGFLTLMSFSDKIKRHTASWVGCAAILFSFICFFFSCFENLQGNMKALTPTLFSWIESDGLYVPLSLYIDATSLIMTLVITGVGFLIHVYSIGYTEHEEDFSRYFACMNFFVFAMLMLVLSGHLVTLFLGWEMVGLASYLLIGYWYTRPAAAAAATKAFVMNRIADLGLLIGILLTCVVFGTGSFAELLTTPFQGDAKLLTLITLLYFVGAIGKSAQLPLHTWLPDAMEGPTPVSALIHAATMVTAGVYLLIRMHPLLLLTPLTLDIIAVIGSLTALFAALCAIAQTDLKKVLAYSTVSQLGFMFASCGVGAFFFALFHLVTHAFMKSLLFLSAGNVVHIMNTTQMEKMGGLRKQFPKTHVLFLIGSLAMAGIPPLAAFFSKDLILEAVFHRGSFLLYLCLAIASLLTAIYLMRAYILTFSGTHRTEPEKLKAVKEAPLIMLLPCALLAFCAVFGGWLEFPIQHLGIDKTSFIEQKEFPWITYISVIGSVLALIGTWILYTRYSYRLKNNVSTLKNAFYFDRIYEKTVSMPLRMLSSFVIYILEPRFFTGILQQIVLICQKWAAALQRLQRGQTRGYFGWIVTGVMVFFGLMLL